MSKVTVRLNDGFRAEIHARNHIWFADEPEEAGGADSGPQPTEMLLGSLGACIAVTVQLYAQRKQWPLEGIDVAVEYEKFNGADYPGYSGGAPFVYEFHEEMIFRGPLTDEQKARLMEIAQKCPVRRILENPVFFVDKQPNAVVK